MRIIAPLILAALLAACGADGEPVPPGQTDNPAPKVTG